MDDLRKKREYSVLLMCLLAIGNPFLPEVPIWYKQSFFQIKPYIELVPLRVIECKAHLGRFLVKVWLFFAIYPGWD